MLVCQCTACQISQTEKLARSEGQSSQLPGHSYTWPSLLVDPPALAWCTSRQIVFPLSLSCPGQLICDLLCPLLCAVPNASTSSVMFFINQQTFDAFYLPDSSSLSLRPAVNVEDVDSDHEIGGRGRGGEGQSNVPQILTPQDPKLTTLTVPVTPSGGRQRWEILSRLVYVFCHWISSSIKYKGS